MATKGTVSGVIANMVTLTVDGPVAQNEICYILTGGDRLMAEVIKVVGSNVYVQVFESTRGLKVGAEAEFTGHMLEVTLGPGMLSKNYDGLQNDLDKMDGVFLKRGQYTYPLDKERVWHFVPLVKVGDEVGPSAWLGQVDENFQPLKIMVPFQLTGTYEVKSIVPEGDYTIEDTVVVLTDREGKDIPVNMIQKWPVKKAMTNYKEKPRPYKLLETGVRVIDTVNPIVEGTPSGHAASSSPVQAAKTKAAHRYIIYIGMFVFFIFFFIFIVYGLLLKCRAFYGCAYGFPVLDFGFQPQFLIVHGYLIDVPLAALQLQDISGGDFVGEIRGVCQLHADEDGACG